MELLALLVRLMLVQPIRTLEQPIEYVTPIGVWTW